jgi:predicted Ser/Thr protein kinase
MPPPLPPDAERTARVRGIFLEALDVPRARRATYVAERCAGDDQVRREVLELFLLHGEEDSILDHAPDASEALRDRGPSLGRGFGPWRIERELGRGGMGVVYLARNDHGAPAGLKLLTGGSYTPELRERFRLEAEILGRLAHPGIARLLGVGEDAGSGGRPQPWIAMEYVEGVPLLEFVRAHALDLPAQLRLLASVCDAVQHAHAHEIVHRDLKPSNILVRPDGHPVVLDFGVARLMGGDERPTELATRTGQLVGTPQYMSPEQVQAEPAGVGPTSDVYSLGMIAYEMLAQQRPYDASSVSLHRAVVSVLTREPAPLGRLMPQLRGPVERIIGKALEKEAPRRYANAGELADDLRRQLDGRTVRARGPSFATRARRWSRFQRRAAAGLASLLALAAFGLIWWIAVHQGPPREVVRAAYLDAESLLRDAVPVLYESERTPATMHEAIALYERARARIADMPRLRHQSLLERAIDKDLGTARMILGELTWDHTPLDASSRSLYRAANMVIDTTAGWIDDSPMLKLSLCEVNRDQCLALFTHAVLLLFRLWGQHSLLETATSAYPAVFVQLRERIGPPRPAGLLTADADQNDGWALAYNDRAELLTAVAASTYGQRWADQALVYSDSAVARRIALVRNPAAFGSLMFVRAEAFRTRGEITGRPADLDSALFWVRACGDYRLSARRVVHAETREAMGRLRLAQARIETVPAARMQLLERARHEIDTALVVLAPVGHPAALANLGSLEAEVLIELARASGRVTLLDSAEARLRSSAAWFKLPDLPHHTALDDIRRARLAAARVELRLPGARIATALEILERARAQAGAGKDSTVIMQANRLLTQLSAVHSATSR